MFAFSYLLMNRAVDRWFSQPVTQMREDANSMALELYPLRRRQRPLRGRLHRRAALRPARRLRLRSRLNHVRSSPRTHPPGRLRRPLPRRPSHVASMNVPQQRLQQHRHIQSLQPADNNTDEAPIQRPPVVTTAHHRARPEQASARRPAHRRALLLHRRHRLHPRRAPPLKHGGVVVVGLPIPAGLAATSSHVCASPPMPTGPLPRTPPGPQPLHGPTCSSPPASPSSPAAGSHSTSASRSPAPSSPSPTPWKPSPTATTPTASANPPPKSSARTRRQLQRHGLRPRKRPRYRRALHRPALRTQPALQARRTELETIIETIPNGVVTLSSDRRIVLANRAFSEMLDPGGRSAVRRPRSLTPSCPAEIVDSLDHLLRRAHRMGSASAEMQMQSSSGILHLSATVALLEASASPDREHLGYVLVLEDATELLRAQKQSAWKEVARRVAHEIKNPLTPSRSTPSSSAATSPPHPALRSAGVESPSPSVIQRSSEVISSSVETMRSLVDQFSALAEFPAARPRPADLNTIVENSLALFAGRLGLIRVRLRPRPQPPTHPRRPRSPQARPLQPHRQRRRSHAELPPPRAANSTSHSALLPPAWSSSA